MRLNVSAQVATSSPGEEVGSKHPTKGTKNARRAAAASYFGGALEYYDFYIFGTAAALVFDEVFFPSSDPIMGKLLALSAFGMAYLVRPLGAILFGHLGDVLGRKKTLVWMLMVMGTGTFAVGLIPSYAQIGIWAPIILLLCRFAQGLSAGGETSGAASLTLEVAPPRRRGFYTSWTVNGIATGFILSALAFIPISAMDEAQRLEWGWRIPFLASAVIFVISYMIRRKLAEPEDLQQALEASAQRREKNKMPLTQAFRTHGIEIVRVALASLFTVVGTMVSIFGLAFARGAGVDSSVILWATIAANAVALILQPFFGIVSDLIGRKVVFIAGALTCGAVGFFYFYSIQTGNVLLIFLATVMVTGIGYSQLSAAYPSFFAEMFHTRVRITGMAVSLQIGLIMAGFAPTFAGWIENRTSLAGWVAVSLIVAVACVVAAVAAATAKETSRLDIQELGKEN